MEEQKKLSDRSIALGLTIWATAVIVGGIYYLTTLFPAWLVMNYVFASMIGLIVGATELMARYRDAPFAPLKSGPGITYFAINGGASMLAYFLLDAMDVPFGSEVLKVLTAGLSAMAFFRSGLFTVRLGDNDVAVGPNLILQIILQALDRSYDRDRATPRSEAVAKIMSGVSFELAQSALPTLCANLMQNVSEEELTELKKEVDGLAGDTKMSDEAKSLILGLALFNVVGEKTLRAGVGALGATIKGSQEIGPELILQMAKVPPQMVIDALPTVVNELCDDGSRQTDPSAATASINALAIAPESKAVLSVHALVRDYGEATVLLALSTLVPPAPPPMPMPAPSPSPAAPPQPDPGAQGS